MDPMTTKPGRRSFLTLLTAALSPAQDTSFVFRKTKVAWKTAGPLQEGVTRTWLGAEFWANRLQDWRLHQGRMECLTGASGDEALTADESAPCSPRSASEDVELHLDVTSAGQGKFELSLTAWDHATGNFLGGALRRNVEEADILGGIGLVSSPTPGRTGARYWFRGLQFAGGKIAVHPERSFGPILGTLYSLNGAVLKLSVQFAPIS